MRIIQGQPAKKQSRKIDLVNDKSTAIEIGRELTTLLFQLNGLKREQGRAGLALHHAQVTSDPIALFVVLPGIIPSVNEADKWDTIIVNAKITDKKDRSVVSEGCMSFPHRSDKKIERYNEVTVDYVTIEGGEFIKRNRTLYGIQAQIFQHECDHQAGVHIYMKK